MLSLIAFAIRAGTPKPDMSTVAAMRQALLAAESGGDAEADSHLGRTVALNAGAALYVFGAAESIEYTDSPARSEGGACVPKPAWRCCRRSGEVSPVGYVGGADGGTAYDCADGGTAYDCTPMGAPGVKTDETKPSRELL